MRVALVTSLNDRLVGPLRRSLDEVEKNLKDVEKELAKVTQGSQQAGQALAGMEGPAKAAKQAAELARNTENAVRLADRLKNAWSAAGSMMNGVVKGMAAYQAARYVVAPALQQARTYDRQLADASNTAFADRDLAGRRAGMGELDAAVTAALRTGGGTREGALQGLQKLLANGVSFDQAKATMPSITMAATASGASTVDIAEIVTKLLKDGFDPKVIDQAIGKAIAAGQAGSFEMKDMAQWIPKLIASGKMSGQSGMADYERMLAMAQVSATTAGGSAEAGNNLLNFLLKLNSSDTSADAKKLGIDLSGSLAAARAKGVSAPEAFLNLVRQTADADPRIVKLRKQFESAGSDSERMASLKSQEAILQGSAVGKLVQDRQALMPLIALLNNPQEFARVLSLVQNGGAQTTKDNFSLIAGTADFRSQQAENEKLFAQTRGVSPVNEALAKMADATTSVYQQFPGFGAAIETAKLALMGLAGAAGAAGLAGLLTGGGKGVVATAAGAAGAAGGVGAAGAIGYAAGSLLYRGIEGTGAADAIGGGVAKLLALLGNDEARSAVASREKYESQMAAERAALAAQTSALSDLSKRPIKLYINEREIAATVDSALDFKARRN
jgi:hypothetical protein